MMRILTRISILVALISIGVMHGLAQTAVAVIEHGSYQRGRDTWKVLQIPPRVPTDRLINLAQELHKANPTIKYHLFDDGSQIQQYLANAFHYPDNSNYPFPEKWFYKHHIGSIQTMAYDRSGPQWVLADSGGVKIVGLEADPLPPPRPTKPAASSSAEAKDGQVIIEYDRFKDLTTVRLKIMTIAEASDGDLVLSALFAYSGHTPPGPGPITLQIISTSNQWKYLYDRSLILLVDGERMPLGEMSRDFAKVVNGLGLESMSMVVPYRTFMKIANAKKLEGKLGDQVFEVKPEFIESLRDLASRMQP